MARQDSATCSSRAPLLRLLIISACLAAGCTAAGTSDGSQEDQCLDLANRFIADHGKHQSPTGDPSKLLYFLHIPRTAGRTCHFCFLKLAHPPNRRCPLGYDVEHIEDRVEEDCGLLSSHDDFSLADQLPSNAAFITQLRDPVGRVLSAYEFAHEVAALDAIDQSSPPATNGTKVDTRNVWPWSFLVPFLAERLRERYPAAKQAAEERAAGTELTQRLDPYDNVVTLPLADFLRHPDVAGTLTNGATLQVLGLTTYSRWPEAAPLRACLPGSPAARRALLALALERLETFAHVGLFDRLDDSVASLAASLGLDLDGPSWPVPSSTLPGQQGTAERPGGARTLVAANLIQKLSVQAALSVLSAASAPGLASGRPRPANSTDPSAGESSEPSVFPLWRTFHRCVDKSRQKQARRRANAMRRLDLPRTARLEFSKASREALPEALIRQIREQNDMDVALYEKGRQLFEARVAELKAAGRWKPLRSKAEANLAEMMKHEAAGAKHTRPQKLNSTAGAANQEWNGVGCKLTVARLQMQEW